MGSEGVNLEERLKSLLVQLHTESGILDRIVYKGKNQHRRCLYFQYLLKVRRDVTLLQSARLEEILNFLFQVINGKKPKQAVHLLESLKKRKCNSEKHNFQERLMGVARLLSQMVEPMLKAAIEISSLLARSFFMGFSLTILALLARLRVLVQQILLDVVSVSNMVSSLSQKEHSIKLNLEGLEVFREYYPSNEEVIALECVWDTDKFVLLEKVDKSETKNRDGHLGVGIEAHLQSSNIEYQSIEALLGEDEVGCQKRDAVCSSEDLPGPTDTKRRKTDASTSQPINNNEAEVGDHGDDDGHEGSPDKNFAKESRDPVCSSEDFPGPTDTKRRKTDASTSQPINNNGAEVGDHGDDDGHEGSSDKNFVKESGIFASTSPFASPKSLKLEAKSGKRVAFVSVRKPTPSQTNEIGFPKKVVNADRLANDREDQFFSLLTGVNMKDSLF